MEYAFAALVVIGVIFLVIFNIRSSRRVREQQERPGGQVSGEAAARSDSAARPDAGDPARLDPTVMQINEILEPVAERRLEDEPELNAPGAIKEQEHRATVEQIVKPDRIATTEQEHRAAAEQITRPDYRVPSEQVAKPRPEPEFRSDPESRSRQLEPQPGSHAQEPDTLRNDAGAAVDKVLARNMTTTRDEDYRQALRQMAEPEQEVKTVPESDDDAGDKAYREALRNILERKSADHREKGRQE
ncbi:hypothetical protein [Paenibacillus sp. SN-8-1]|uniref:hypothetical protein n=1 Tax=Paenibacillus sp. SN-8-1 TaxID=3435409 RepID=UPI003D9A7D38